MNGCWRTYYNVFLSFYTVVIFFDITAALQLSVNVEILVMLFISFIYVCHIKVEFISKHKFILQKTLYVELSTGMTCLGVNN